LPEFDGFGGRMTRHDDRRRDQRRAPDDAFDIDPRTAGTVAEFAACLRQVRIRADVSFRALARWGQEHRTPLPRSTVSDALAGARLPSKELVIGFLRACGIDPRADTRWLLAWTRLAESSAAPVTGRDEAASIDPAASRREGDLAAHLAADVRAAGLRRIGATYLADLDWESLFTGVHELDIFVAYGRTWRNLHAQHLNRLAATASARIRVFLPDIRDEATVAGLADRFAISPAELRARVIEARDDYAAMRRRDGARLDIYARRGDHVFSCYRLDDVAVVGMYSHTRTRRTSIPVFVCAAPGQLYTFITEELHTIEEQSTLWPDTPLTGGPGTGED
jgi:hypothetical protein